MAAYAAQQPGVHREQASGADGPRDPQRLTTLPQRNQRINAPESSGLPQLRGRPDESTRRHENQSSAVIIPSSYRSGTDGETVSRNVSVLECPFCASRTPHNFSPSSLCFFPYESSPTLYHSPSAPKSDL
jgi:hypothetical protein